jgi:hypothetical protein
MDRIWKFLEAATDKTAHQTVIYVAVPMLVVGTLFFSQIVRTAQPYQYKVQCQAPRSSGSRIVLVSRKTGLTNVGPAPEAGGGAAIKSDGRFEDYDITLENNPCVLEDR